MKIMLMMLSRNEKIDDIVNEIAETRDMTEEITKEEEDNYEGNNILLFTFSSLFREIFFKHIFFFIKSFLFTDFTTVNFAKILAMSRTKKSWLMII